MGEENLGGAKGRKLDGATGRLFTVAFGLPIPAVIIVCTVHIGKISEIGYQCR